MTIQTPTSNGGGMLLDEAVLNRLANEFFAALPGGASRVPEAPKALPVDAGRVSAPAFAPTLPAAGPTAITSSVPAPGSAALPASTGQTGVPDVVQSAAPATGRGGNHALGVPEAYAPALPQSIPLSGVPAPQIPGAGSAAPSTPYYFLGEASAYPSAAPKTSDANAFDDRVAVQSFALPGAADLKALLGADTRNPVQAPSAAPSANSSQFYFLQDPRVTDNQLPAAAPAAHPPFDVHAVRRDFPILQERVNGRPLIWLDNAATTHKPQAVIDRLAYFYAHENSNIHRAAHELAARATDAYEGARNKVARFLNAGSAEEIIFVRGATEAINLIAKTWGKQHVGAGDEIVVSQLEHHANIVPWQQLAGETGAVIRVIPVDDSGQILLEEYRRLLNDRTKLVAITQVSNALGTITPVREIVDLAHRNGTCVLVDGAQAVSHMRVDVQALDADFYVFSGHKVFGPTGIGAVYGKAAILEAMQPWQGGGNMIADVTFERTIYNPAPSRFEAGTGNIADAVGLGAAIDYVERIGLENIARYEHDLLVYATRLLSAIPGLRLIGTARDKASVLSFVFDGYTTQEVGTALNREGIAVRSGHHCAQPILRRFGQESTVRPSLAFYNTCQEIDVLAATLLQLRGQRR